MTTLRDKIIKALAGSSGQKPVLLTTLQKIAEPICDDLQQLYGLLDHLYAGHAVNRASGFKEGKQYIAYWETGAQPPAITFRITQPAPPQRVHRLEPTAKAAAPQPQPTSTQETTMSPKRTQDHSGKLRAFILDLITKQPGISKASVTEYAEVEFPDAGDRIRQTLGNLVTSGKIKGEGKRGSLTYRATASASATIPASAPPKRPPQPTPPAARSKGAVCTGQVLDISFHLDGSLFIGRGEQAIALEPKEALQLMQFCSHQLPFADRAPA